MLPVSLARSFSGGIVMRYVLPVFRMTSCFPIIGPMTAWRYGAVLLLCRVRPNIPVAWYWLRPAWLFPRLVGSIVKGCWGGVCNASFSYYICGAVLNDNDLCARLFVTEMKSSPVGQLPLLGLLLERRYRQRAPCICIWHRGYAVANPPWTGGIGNDPFSI